MEEYRDLYEHHWVIEIADDGIDEARKYFDKFFQSNEGSYFKCTENEGKKPCYIVLLLQVQHLDFAINQNKLGGLLSLDIALAKKRKRMV